MKHKRGIVRWLALLIIAVGVIVLGYPLVSNLLYHERVEATTKEFDKYVNDHDKDARLEQLYQRMKVENERLYHDGQKDLKDPFSYDTAGIDLREYGIMDGVVGYLSIPRISETLPILLGANKANMAKGAAHMTQTSYPIGGPDTNTVLAAHRGFSKAAMFRHIEKIQINDKVYIKNFRETLTFKVVRTKIIAPDQVENILIEDGKEMLTLLTCHPYRHNYQRYLVYCERVS